MLNIMFHGIQNYKYANVDAKIEVHFFVATDHRITNPYAQYYYSISDSEVS